MRHHALREERGKRLFHIKLANMRQGPRPEARIKQVQNRMLDPADIMLDRHPFGDFFCIKRSIIGLRGKAQEIPAGIGECVERVRLAHSILAASRAADMLPACMSLQRIARRFKVHILWQSHWQLIFGNRHNPASIAVDERDRCSPIALARNAPIAQPPHSRALAPSAVLSPRNHIGLGLFHRLAIEELRIDQNAVARFCLIAHWRISLACVLRDNTHYRQLIFGCKFEIALVMAGHAHHCACAIIHQHKIGDEERHRLACEGMLGSNAGFEAQLLCCL